MLRTNLDGAFHAIRRAAPDVRARFGRIVNIGSVAGLTGSAGQANYAAAKAGLVGLTRPWPASWRPATSPATWSRPGPIATAMTDALPDERQAELAGSPPLGRFGTPDEVAAAVAFLCSRRRRLHHRRRRPRRRRPRPWATDRPRLSPDTARRDHHGPHGSVRQS